MSGPRPRQVLQHGASVLVEGFLELEARGWVRCWACGADVRDCARVRREHVEARCLARNVGTYQAERLIETVDSL